MLDTKPKQRLYEEETGYKAIENGSFTYKYKMWLLQQEEEKNNARMYQNPTSEILSRNTQGEIEKHRCPYCGAEFS